jgi:hypothetical protein
MKLANDDEKKVLESLASKDPNLKKYYDSGEVLEGLRPRFKQLHETYEANPELAVDELAKWHAWKKDKWPTWQSDHQRVEAALATAQAEVAELQNNRSTEVTPEEIKEIVQATLKEAGFVKSDELESKITESIKKEVGPTLDNRVNGLTKRFEKVYAKLTPKASQHEKTFGEPLDYDGLFEFMNKNGLEDPEAAYKQFYGEKFTAKSAEQIASDKKAEYDKGIAEGKKAALKEVAKERSMPVDGRPAQSAAPKGALWRRALARMPKDDKGDVDGAKIPLGKGVSKFATQEYYDKKAEAVQ